MKAQFRSYLPPVPALNRYAPKSCPAGFEDDRKPHTLPCVCCEQPVAITDAFHQAAVRLGLLHTVCDRCEKETEGM